MVSCQCHPPHLKITPDTQHCTQLSSAYSIYRSYCLTARQQIDTPHSFSKKQPTSKRFPHALHSMSSNHHRIFCHPLIRHRWSNVRLFRRKRIQIHSSAGTIGQWKCCCENRMCWEGEHYHDFGLFETTETLYFPLQVELMGTHGTYVRVELPYSNKVLLSVYSSVVVSIRLSSSIVLSHNSYYHLNRTFVSTTLPTNAPSFSRKVLP